MLWAKMKSGLSAYTPVDFSRSACGKSDLGLTINHLLMFLQKIKLNLLRSSKLLLRIQSFQLISDHVSH